MPFDLNKVLDERKGENFALHTKYVNPQLPRVLGTLEFDRFYVKGEGCYLVDDKGDRYLDFLSGFGVFALGRGHPAIVQALHDALDADLPNLVQMDCSLLPGVLAEQLVARSHPGIGRVVFTNSGAEAVESAIKFARVATKRDITLRELLAELADRGVEVSYYAVWHILDRAGISFKNVWPAPFAR